MRAEISPCGQYRYWLSRPATARPEKGTALFCMLNPSTADASVDDPTIRRCRGFAERWGCNGFTVVNLYALRATNPKALLAHADPFGPENEYWIRHVAREYGDVVCAWGANADPVHANKVAALFVAGRARLWCLGRTKHGHPRHPLYVRGDQPLEEFAP